MGETFLTLCVFWRLLYSSRLRAVEALTFHLEMGENRSLTRCKQYFLPWFVNWWSLPRYDVNPGAFVLPDQIGPDIVFNKAF